MQPVHSRQQYSVSSFHWTIPARRVENLVREKRLKGLFLDRGVTATHSSDALRAKEALCFFCSCRKKLSSIFWNLLQNDTAFENVTDSAKRKSVSVNAPFVCRGDSRLRGDILSIHGIRGQGGPGAWVLRWNCQDVPARIRRVTILTSIGSTGTQIVVQSRSECKKSFIWSKPSAVCDQVRIRMRSVEF